MKFTLYVPPQIKNLGIKFILEREGLKILPHNILQNKLNKNFYRVIDIGYEDEDRKNIKFVVVKKYKTLKFKTAKRIGFEKTKSLVLDYIDSTQIKYETNIYIVKNRLYIKIKNKLLDITKEHIKLKVE